MTTARKPHHPPIIYYSKKTLDLPLLHFNAQCKVACGLSSFHLARIIWRTCYICLIMMASWANLSEAQWRINTKSTFSNHCNEVYEPPEACNITETWFDGLCDLFLYASPGTNMHDYNTLLYLIEIKFGRNKIVDILPTFSVIYFWSKIAEFRYN